MALTYGQLQTKYGLQIEMEKQREKEEKKKLLLLEQYGERMSPFEVVDGKKVYVGYTEEFLISKGKQRPLYEIGGECNCKTCLAGGCCKPTMRCAFPRKNRPFQINAVESIRKTQTISQMNYWMFTLPVLVLAVVLIGGRK